MTSPPVFRQDRSARQQAAIQDDDQQRAQDAVFLNDETEHIIFEHDRYDVALGTASRALADDAAFADGNLRADRLLDFVQSFLELDGAPLQFQQLLFRILRRPKDTVDRRRDTLENRAARNGQYGNQQQ